MAIDHDATIEADKLSRSHRAREDHILLGQQEGDDSMVAGVMERSASASFNVAAHKETSKQKKKRQSKADFESFMLIISAELQAVSDRIAEQEKSLADKYGEDFFTGMAETFLTEDELDGLETDQQKLDALYDEFIENGEIKPEYEGSEEAQYILNHFIAQALQAIKDGQEPTARQKEVLEKFEGDQAVRQFLLDDGPEPVNEEAKSELEQSGELEFKSEHSGPVSLGFMTPGS